MKLLTDKRMTNSEHQSGRGAFAVGSWERVPSDPNLAYPQHGRAVGIEPIDGQAIDLQERDERRDQIVMRSPDGKNHLPGELGGITISEQGGAANGSQPTGPDLNRTPSDGADG
jgi:hypothetical protein